MHVRKSIASFLVVIVFLFTAGISFAEYCKDGSSDNSISFLCDSLTDQNCCVNHADEKLSLDIEVFNNNFNRVPLSIFYTDNLNTFVNSHLIFANNEKLNYLIYSPSLISDLPVLIQCFRI